ncbi:MAG: hypothetical protein ACRDSJ_19830 [Rubrobacteraceae bacterium]
MAKSGGVEEVANWLSTSEAGRVLGTSGQWVKQLARRGKLRGVETSLGWLVDPEDVERLANERLEKAEKKISTMKAAKSRKAVRVLASNSKRGRLRSKKRK